MWGVLKATRIEGASPCPHSNHTSSNPSGNSSKPSCPRGRSTIRSAATGPAFPIEWFSRSSLRFWSSAAPTLEDRRREVFGNHDEAKARRVGGGRSDGLAGGDRFAILRPDDRPRAFRRVGRRVHYESSVRRRQIGHKPGRQGKAGHQTLDDGGRERHTSGGGRGGSQSPRFAASLSHPRRRRRQADGKAAVELPEQAGVHLDRAYDSRKTRQLLEERGLVGVIAKKGVPAPLVAGLRWVVERTNSWHNAHKKLVWCTEREDRVNRLLDRALERGHSGQEAHPRGLGSLPLGRPTLPQTIAYWRKL